MGNRPYPLRCWLFSCIGEECLPTPTPFINLLAALVFLVPLFRSKKVPFLFQWTNCILTGSPNSSPDCARRLLCSRILAGFFHTKAGRIFLFCLLFPLFKGLILSSLRRCFSRVVLSSVGFVSERDGFPPLLSCL